MKKIQSIKRRKSQVNYLISHVYNLENKFEEGSRKKKSVNISTDIKVLKKIKLTITHPPTHSDFG